MERQLVIIGSEIFPPLAPALGERVAQSTCPRRQSPEGGKESRKGDQQPFLFWGTRLFCLYLVVVLGTQEAKFLWDQTVITTPTAPSSSSAEKQGAFPGELDNQLFLRDGVVASSTPGTWVE